MKQLLIALLVFCAPLSANDIGISTPDGGSAWLLLERAAAAGEGFSPYAADPGLPAPDVLGRPAAARPQLDLWRYDTQTRQYALEARIAVRGTYLYAVFELAGEPYVLLSQPVREAPTLVLKAAGLQAESVPQERVVLALPVFADAPVVSPDGTKLTLRAFSAEAGKAVVRIYSTADWKLVAESAPDAFSRPVWISNTSLCSLTSDAGISRVSLGEAGATPHVNENPLPFAGRLVRLDMQDAALQATELLAGEFPPETFTRALQRDLPTGGVVIARKDGGEIVVEQRAATPGAEPQSIARFQHFRGLVAGILDSTGHRIYCAGVIEGQLHLAALWQHGSITLPRMPFARHARRIELPVGPVREIFAPVPLERYSPLGLGGLIDLGRGNMGILEAVANPAHAQPGQPVCLHTFSALTLRGCDSMRNPRNLARISGLVKRFAELDALYRNGVPSTLLAFEMTISMPDAPAKSGTYVELYHGDGRGRKGRLRTEDNLGGNWVMHSIDGDGTREGDTVYSCDDIRGGVVNPRPITRAGKLYDDMVTQLEARRLLMLGGADRAEGNGGLTFMRRALYRDIAGNQTLRVWQYEKLGRLMPDGSRERVVLQFVAEMPGGTRGAWGCPHTLVNARMAFSVAGDGGLSGTEICFAPDSFVSLPNLTAPANPPLLLPREFRIYDSGDSGQPVQRLHARALDAEFAYPPQIEASGRLRPGYNPSPLSVPVFNRTAADSRFRELKR